MCKLNLRVVGCEDGILLELLQNLVELRALVLAALKIRSLFPQYYVDRSVSTTQAYPVPGPDKISCIFRTKANV
jgi:hypothetical protein